MMSLSRLPGSRCGKDSPDASRRRLRASTRRVSLCARSETKRVCCPCSEPASVDIPVVASVHVPSIYRSSVLLLGTLASSSSVSAEAPQRQIPNAAVLIEPRRNAPSSPRSKLPPALRDCVRRLLDDAFAEIPPDSLRCRVRRLSDDTLSETSPTS